MITFQLFFFLFFYCPRSVALASSFGLCCNSQLLIKMSVRLDEIFFLFSFFTRLEGKIRDYEAGILIGAINSRWPSKWSSGQVLLRLQLYQTVATNLEMENKSISTSARLVHLAEDESSHCSIHKCSVCSVLLATSTFGPFFSVLFVH